MQKDQNRKAKVASRRRIVWGAKAIGEAVPSDPPLTVEQTQRLLRKGVFGTAVQKVGHRTWAGDYDLLSQLNVQSLLPHNPDDEAA